MTNQIKSFLHIKTIVLSFAIILSFVASNSANADAETIAIVKFLGIPAKMQKNIKTANLDSNDPELIAVSTKAFALFDQEEIARRLGDVFDSKLSPSDKSSIIVFMKSPAGSKTRIILAKNSPAEISEAFKKLSPADSKAIGTFLGSPAMNNTTKALGSAESR